MVNKKEDDELTKEDCLWAFVAMITIVGVVAMISWLAMR